MKSWLHLALLVVGLAALPAPAEAVERQFKCDNLAQRAEFSPLNIAVYQGDEGWFFRYSDLNHFYLASPDTVSFLHRLTDALAFHDVALALLPLPPKSILEPSHSLAATGDGDVLFDPDFARTAFEGFVAELKAQHLTVADVLATLRTATDLPDGEFYFAHDVHWRPKLAKASAEAVKQLLLEVEGRGIVGDRHFKTVQLASIENHSQSNAIFNQLCSDPVTPEMLDLYVTSEADQSVDSFLDDSAAKPSIDVVGTSFTDEANQFNFAGFLREYMQDDVATYSISGGGIETSLYKWAHAGLAATSGAKALVWELPFPERLAEVVPVIEREIIPAIAGSCTGSPEALQSAAFELPPDGSFKLTLDPTLKVSGDNYFVTADLSNPSIHAFTLTFDYRDGRRDILPVIRPDRVPSVDKLFGELTREIDTDLDTVTLQNPGGGAVSGTLSLCRYPASIWRSQLAANPERATP